MFPQGIQLGRVFGVRISLDWSLIFIFLLVTFNLGAGVFPHWHADWSPALVWTVSLAAGVLFFASILLHELSHALVARAYGIPVRRITLFLFGGVANIERDPSSPKQEALMAAVGPLTSIALGVGFSVLGGWLAQIPSELASDPLAALRSMGPLSTLLTWLGPVNVLLGMFNLVPAFPLDGGRILRAILWASQKNFDAATRRASQIGQAFGWAFILVGISMAFGLRVPFFGTGLAGGMWLAFIGWFLNSAAVMSYRQIVVKKLLEDVPILRLMRHHLPPKIDVDRSVGSLVDELMSSGESLLLAAEEDRIVGLISARDVRRVARTDWETTTVRQIMTPLDRVPTADPGDDASEAVTRLARDDALEVVAICKHGRLIGIVRNQDVARWIDLQAEEPPAGRGTPHWAG